jgi:menaquinone-dependent protoporphyrinogen oxidase
MKVLVTVASKHGGTAEIADAIARALEKNGHSVAVIPPRAVADPATYDAVILGSGVYAGHWLQEAKAFAWRHAAALKARPLWLISSGPLGKPPLPAEDPVDVADLDTLLKPRGHDVFPGVMDHSKLGFGERALVAMVKAPYGDYRDWPAITAWSYSVHAQLAEAGSVQAGAR